jgi:hypothetical protein
MRYTLPTCVKIGEKEYSVIVLGITETFTKLFTDNTGRMMGAGAKMNLDCLGTFFGHRVEIARKSGFEADFDELYDLVSLPTNDGIPVKMVHNQTSIEYETYISNGERAVKRIDERNNKVYWDKLLLNIIPMEAQKKI